MTKRKWTAGEWRRGFQATSEYDGEKNGKPIRSHHIVWEAIENDRGQKIATTSIYVQSHGKKAERIPESERKANANLFVASPELFEALEEAEHVLRGYEHGNLSSDLVKSIADKAQAALAAALREE